MLLKLEDSRDWLGRGGLMGLPWIAFPSHLAGVLTRIKVYALSGLWLLFAAQYFAYQMLLVVFWLLPDGGATYKKANAWFDYLAQPAILATPYSWCGLRVHTSQYDLTKKMGDVGNVLVMTNHCSRVDWLVGLLLGNVVLGPNTRVGFLAEYTKMIMPVFGWSRFLHGDIFLLRTFHRDHKRILDNLRSFHEAKVSRMLFVAPEGAIVDPGVVRDEEYVEQCESFMKSLGRDNLRYLLTPRFKGMQLLSTHAPRSAYSVTMAFRCPSHSSNDDDREESFVSIDAQSGRARGGELCTRRLDDPLRIIPDMHTVFRGGLHVFCHVHRIDMPTDATHHQVRDLLIADYERKDSLLREFETHGRFSCDDDYKLTTLPISHIRMNLTLIAHTMLSVQFALMRGYGLFEITNAALVSWALLSVVHAVTHLYAEKISGASRESIIFETIFKMFMESWLGKLNHGRGFSSQTTDK